MKKATIEIEGISPLSWSRYIDPAQHPKHDGESSDDYDARIWRNRFHCDDKGCFIPAMAFKRALEEAAAYSGDKIKGQGQKTWKGKFVAGVLVTDNSSLGVMPDDLVMEALFVPGSPGTGKKGIGKRVVKRFPVLAQWRVVLVLYVLDESITKEVLARYLELAGKFVGIGRWRISVGGLNGRFAAEITDWSDA